MWDKFSREYGGFTGWAWMAIFGALMIRALHMKHGTWWGALKESVTGLFCAYTLTKPVMILADLPSEAKIGVSVLLAIWGGKVIVLVLEAPSITDLLKAWRGK